MVAIEGSSRSARAARALVAAAASWWPTRGSERNHDVHALGSAGLEHADQARPVQGLPDQARDLYDDPEVGSGGRIQVEHQVGRVITSVKSQCRVVLDGSLIRQPEQGAAVVAQGVPDRAM